MAGLFPDPLPLAHKPGGERLHGPYARQDMRADAKIYRIKFWFGLMGDFPSLRYELICDRGEPVPKFRQRGMANSFKRHALPDDLSRYPSVAYPRHKGDRLELAMQSLISEPDDVADVLRLTRFGIAPL